MRQYVVNECLRPWDGISVENRVGEGTPDINYGSHIAEGFIELKQLLERPKRGGPIRVPKFSQTQRVWIIRRAHSGGTVHVCLQLEQTWFLFDGAWAAEYLGGEREGELRANAIRVWEGRPDPEQFREALLYGQ